MRTLHERVAEKMALSDSVGPYASYDVILVRLRAQFGRGERDAKAAGIAHEDWKFVE